MKRQKIQIVPIEAISQKIYIVRGIKVMIDADLAKLYGVTTGNLNLAVMRNRTRFPEDFMFQMTDDEYRSLILQSARPKIGRGGRRNLPYVFTEHGVAMLSSVLRSDRAIEMNISIVRAFVKIREMLATNKEVAHKLEKLEREQLKQGEHISVIHDILKKLIAGPSPSKKRIGFKGE